MRVQGDPTADLYSPIANCEVEWRKGVMCPNAAVTVIVCTNDVGFIPVCDFHKTAYESEYPTATVEYVTRKEFLAHRAEYLDPAHPGRRAGEQPIFTATETKPLEYTRTERRDNDVTPPTGIQVGFFFEGQDPPMCRELFAAVNADRLITIAVGAASRQYRVISWQRSMQARAHWVKFNMSEQGAGRDTKSEAFDDDIAIASFKTQMREHRDEPSMVLSARQIQGARLLIERQEKGWDEIARLKSLLEGAQSIAAHVRSGHIPPEAAADAQLDYEMRLAVREPFMRDALKAAHVTAEDAVDALRDMRFETCREIVSSLHTVTDFLPPLTELTEFMRRELLDSGTRTPPHGDALQPEPTIRETDDVGVLENHCPVCGHLEDECVCP